MEGAPTEGHGRGRDVHLDPICANLGCVVLREARSEEIKKVVLHDVKKDFGTARNKIIFVFHSGSLLI